MLEYRWGEKRESRPGGVKALASSRLTLEQRKRLAGALGAGESRPHAGRSSDPLIAEADAAIAKGERQLRILEGTAQAKARAVSALRARRRSGRG